MKSNRIGPQTTGQAHPPTHPAVVPAAVPATLADVALIDAAGIAAAACIGVSYWHQLVLEGKAPKPAFRRPRCTRWRMADVRTWLEEFAAQGNTPAGRTAACNLQKTLAAASKAATRQRAAVQARA